MKPAPPRAPWIPAFAGMTAGGGNDALQSTCSEVPEHVEVVMRDAAAIAEWRQENPGLVLDLGKANFRYANLRGADLILASLSGPTSVGPTFGAV